MPVKPISPKISGQTTVEYVVILFFVVGLSATLVKTLLQTVDKGIMKMGSVMEKGFKTGRHSPAIWRN